MGRTLYLPLAENALRSQARQEAEMFLNNEWEVLDVTGPVGDEAVTQLCVDQHEALVKWHRLHGAPNEQALALEQRARELLDLKTGDDE